MAARSNADIANIALLYAGVNLKISTLTDNSAEAQAINTIFDEKRKQVLNEFRWPFAIKRAQLVPYAGAAWDATVTYAAGALVQFGSNVYRSLLAANLNHEPDLNASTAWWAQVTRDGYAYACPLPADCLDPIEMWEKATVAGFSTPQVFNLTSGITGANLRNPRSMDRQPWRLENANDGTDNLIILTDLDVPILRYAADVTNPSAFPSVFVETLAWHLAAPLAMGLRGDEKKAAACEAKARSTLAEAYIVNMRDMQEDDEPISEFEASREGAP